MFDLYILDDWQGETMQYDIDNYVATKPYTNDINNVSLFNICGNPTHVDSFFKDASFHMVHTGTISTKIKISNFNSIPKLWGISNILILLENNCADDCLECNSFGCTSCPTLADKTFNDVENKYICQCKEGFYLNEDKGYLQCSPCYYTCQFCDGILSTNCLSCRLPFVLDDYFECQLRGIPHKKLLFFLIFR